MVVKTALQYITSIPPRHIYASLHYHHSKIFWAFNCRVFPSLHSFFSYLRYRVFLFNLCALRFLYFFRFFLVICESFSLKFQCYQVIIQLIQWIVEIVANYELIFDYFLYSYSSFSLFLSFISLQVRGTFCFLQA